jgi:hypothetical protein
MMRHAIPFVPSTILLSVLLYFCCSQNKCSVETFSLVPKALFQSRQLGAKRKRLQQQHVVNNDKLDYHSLWRMNGCYINNLQDCASAYQKLQRNTHIEQKRYRQQQQRRDSAIHLSLRSFFRKNSVHDSIEHNDKLDTLPISISPSSSPAELISTTAKQDVIVALEKVAQRQRDDLDGTNAILLQLKKMDDNKHREVAADSNEPLVQQTVASLLSGVNYGFQSRSEGCINDKSNYINDTLPALTDVLTTSLNSRQQFQESGPPGNLLKLGLQQFVRNWRAMKGEYYDEASINLTSYQRELQQALDK